MAGVTSWIKWKGEVRWREGEGKVSWILVDVYVGKSTGLDGVKVQSES